MFALEVLGLALGLSMLHTALESFLPKFHEASFFVICAVVAFLFLSRPPQENYKKESPLRLVIGLFTGFYAGMPFALASVIFSAAEAIIYGVMFFTLPIIISSSEKIANYVEEMIKDALSNPLSVNFGLVFSALSLSFSSIELEPSVPPPRSSLA